MRGLIFFVRLMFALVVGMGMSSSVSAQDIPHEYTPIVNLWKHPRTYEDQTLLVEGRVELDHIMLKPCNSEPEGVITNNVVDCNDGCNDVWYRLYFSWNNTSIEEILVRTDGDGSLSPSIRYEFVGIWKRDPLSGGYYLDHKAWQSEE
jgi:hypothetical protein